MNDYKKLIVVFIALIMILVVGVIGYSTFLNVNLLDALYMTVITISTVGFQEVAVMTPEAKLFSILIIFLGLSFVGYLFTSLAAFLLEGSMKEILKKRRINNKMKSLENHYILCGAGETGANVIRQFEKKHVPYIVIDNNKERVAALIERGVMALYGDATNEEALIEAGILKARGLISSLSNDADNVFTVLTSRSLNKDLHIIARSIDDHASEKLMRAGANRTISPNEIGGRRMAALMLQPTVISFLDLITHAGDVELDLDEVVLFPGSEFIGLSLKEARIPDKTGLVILAIQKSGTKEMIFNPGSETILQNGDSMIVLGKSERVLVLKKLSKDSGKREYSFKKK